MEIYFLDFPIFVLISINDERKEWYLNGEDLTEKEFNSRKSCNNKVVEIDGKKYKLVEV